MSSPELLDAVPYWTEKMYPPGGGQDHLGLGSVVTDRVLPRLSPGINVLTIHPRYWSFYAFVLSEFWSRDLPRTKAALKAWYRPLECIYSVACSLCDGPRPSRDTDRNASHQLCRRAGTRWVRSAV